MDHRGHPKRPLARRELPLEGLAASFLAACAEEDPPLARTLEPLDPLGRRELGGVLGRFDLQRRGELDPGQRLLVRRVLGRLHRPSGETLALLNRVLDYLDLDANAVLDPAELELCVEVLERFARADSDNDTLSPLELRMLHGVLRHLDADDSGALEPHERQRLRRGLDDPRGFLAEQKERNPRLRELLARERR